MCQEQDAATEQHAPCYYDTDRNMPLPGRAAKVGAAFEGMDNAMAAALDAGGTSVDRNSVPVELVGVAYQIEQGAGFWSPCSGCHDTEDGHPTAKYAFSMDMRCALGNGCSECGGIGAIWDNTDYAAMGEELEQASDQGAPQPVDAAQAVPDLMPLVHELRRAIGDHHAPNDCYATGPLTGDEFRDLVQCPACSAIAMFNEAVAAQPTDTTKGA